ncbi:MAG: DNA gyrase/topoisomerase IV subunit A, partial [Croceivirga sp.]
VTKVDSKTFIDNNIIHVAVFKKMDKRTTFNMVYKDCRGGASYIKRFNVTSITRDKMYDLTNGKASSDVLYFSANPNGEAEVVTVHLRHSGSIKKLKWDVDFADVLIKGRASKGNIVTKYPVKRIELKEKGLSTLKPRKIWFDDVVQRLNVDERGELLGEFRAEDMLLVANQRGFVKTILPDLNARFDDDMIVLEKWNQKKPVSAIYYEGEKERYYIKRFVIDNPNREEFIISEHRKSQLELLSTDWRPQFEIEYAKQRGKDQRPNDQIDVEGFIAVKGIKALGNQVTSLKVKNINALQPLPYEEQKDQIAEEIEVVDEEDVSNNTGDTENTDQTTLF